MATHPGSTKSKSHGKAEKPDKDVLERELEEGLEDTFPPPIRWPSPSPRRITP